MTRTAVLWINWDSDGVASAKTPFRVLNCGKALVYMPIVAAAIGCSRSTTERISVLDPSAATAKVLEQYDRNGDRKLSVQELKASAALSVSAARIDKNR